MEKIVNKVIGYILLSPALISVVLFVIQLIDKNANTLRGFGYAWIGRIDYFSSLDGSKGGGGGGFTSALPFYIALMALAGVYLIKDNKK